MILSGKFGVCGQFSAAGKHTLFDSDTESEMSKVAQICKSCAYVAYKLLSALYYDVLSVSVQCYTQVVALASLFVQHSQTTVLLELVEVPSVNSVSEQQHPGLQHSCVTCDPVFFQKEGL